MEFLQGWIFSHIPRVKCNIYFIMPKVFCNEFNKCLLDHLPFWHMYKLFCQPNGTKSIINVYHIGMAVIDRKHSLQQWKQHLKIPIINDFMTIFLHGHCMPLAVIKGKQRQSIFSATRGKTTNRRIRNSAVYKGQWILPCDMDNYQPAC